jgi:hypothetical protein
MCSAPPPPPPPSPPGTALLKIGVIMKTFIFFWILLLGLVAGAPTSHAKHVHDHIGLTDPSIGGDITVAPGTMVLETKGMVCSFCAYGAKKKVTKLKFVDRSQGKDKGVLTDIKTGRMTVQILRDQPIELKKVVHAIEKAGYGLIGIHLQVSGTLSSEETQWFLTSSSNGQRFKISGDAVKNVEAGQALEIQAHVDPAQLASPPKDGVTHLLVDRVGALS